ncbi:unnamed protein product [Arctogadus glacialis]
MTSWISCWLAAKLTNTQRQQPGANSEQTSSVLPQQVTSDPRQEDSCHHSTVSSQRGHAWVSGGYLLTNA